MLVHGDDPNLRILRAQLERATIASVEVSKAGRYVNFAVPDSADLTTISRSFELGDVHAEVPGMAAGIGFMLFVRDGKIAFMEAFSCGEDLAERPRMYELKYWDKTTGNGIGIRNMAEVRQMIYGELSS